MGTPITPPEKPVTPVTPSIPEGLATKLGKYGALASAVLAALAAIFDVELNAETLAAFVGSIVLLVTTMAGRFAQATALYRDSPKDILETLVDYADEFEDDVEDQAPPSDEELKNVYKGDPPEDPAAPEIPASSALGMTPDDQKEK